MTKTDKGVLGILGGIVAFFGIRHFLKAAPPDTGVVIGSAYNIETGEPLAGVQCQLNSAAPAKSKADGTFKLANVPEGSYMLSLKKEFYEEVSMAVEVIAGETTDVGAVGMVPIPTTGALTGTAVESGTGKPVAGASVVVSGPVVRETSTDGSGVFLFSDLPEGVYNGEINAPGYNPGYF